MFAQQDCDKDNYSCHKMPGAQEAGFAQGTISARTATAAADIQVQVKVSK